MSLHVRPATVRDAAGCAEVYAPYVLGTAVSFETEPPDPAAMAGRIEAAQASHAWLVAEDDGVLLGYAYAGPYRSRPAYRWTAEVSVYVAAGAHGRGVGRALYQALLARLVQRGYRTAVAGTTLPNPASLALHEALGFTPAGVLHAVGWKAGRWHDVALLELALGEGAPEETPAEPR
ncbi:GNAT family N-acetyltransferase [Microlunatus flavus]|uniref:Phosphinothricin acetyltransferase n=1 Tax=Microlunatus flavus TaxID=1036181 RepID=A0A1H9EVK7_9ACTN|nr:GNAT family N-acetyltransferase [Microlunatus flavus]SEQ29796.1 phosphinothricin acetyltransferase [Microlunatus flavus]